MHFSKVAVIFNPKGGSARKSGLNQLMQTLIATGATVVALPTTAEPNSATELTKAAIADGADLVVAFGGDGTVRKVAEALVGTQTPMAVYPGGTGNLFARSFSSRPTSESFAAMIADGHPQPIDLIRYTCTAEDGSVETGLFLVAMGFGGLSDAISTADPAWKRVFGQLVYAVKVGRASLNPKITATSFATAHGDKKEHIATGFVLNVATPLMTNISRGCNASDGLMDVVALKATNFLQLLSTSFWLARCKPEQSKHYRRQRVSDIRLRFETPVNLNVDGDPGPSTKDLQLTVLPGAVNMLLS